MSFLVWLGLYAFGIPAIGLAIGIRALIREWRCRRAVKEWDARLLLDCPPRRNP